MVSFRLELLHPVTNRIFILEQASQALPLFCGADMSSQMEDRTDAGDEQCLSEMCSKSSYEGFKTDGCGIA